MRVHVKFDWLQVESCMQEMDQRVEGLKIMCHNFIGKLFNTNILKFE